jgi:hypothetical protein
LWKTLKDILAYERYLNEFRKHLKIWPLHPMPMPREIHLELGYHSPTQFQTAADAPGCVSNVPRAIEYCVPLSSCPLILEQNKTPSITTEVMGHLRKCA